VVADGYLAAGRRWAERACCVARDMNGEHAPAHRVWVDALAEGCWQRGGPPLPDFERLWRDGNAAPPLEVLTRCVAHVGRETGTDVDADDSAVEGVAELNVGGEAAAHEWWWWAWALSESDEGGEVRARSENPALLVLVRRCLLCCQK